MKIPLRDRARGRWFDILVNVGINSRFLNKKNGPCPLCGGRDRWRWRDTNGDGTWVCTHCSVTGGGDGISLVMRFLGLPFREAAKRIEAAMGEARIRPQPRQRDPKPWLRAIWNCATRVRHGDPVDQYLRSRGVELDVYPSCLRTSSLRYPATGILFPVMIACVTGIDGKPITIHRTFLAPDGSGKAPVDKPRMVCSATGKGATVRLAPPAPTMGIAEGIETALSAARLFDVPTWAALCATGIETFEPPLEAKHLFIFGDNDANHIGQRAVHALAARLAGRLEVEVRIPPEPGSDWNDVLRGGP
jgi:putative DNA primase/helicase